MIRVINKSIDRSSHQYFLNNSQDKNKCDPRLETEQPVNHDNLKDTNSHLNNEENMSSSQKNVNMIDYILNLDNLLRPKNSIIKEEEQKVVGEDDMEIENSNPFEENPKYKHQAVDGNLLSINDDQPSNAWQNQESQYRSSSRSSFPAYVDASIETKEGWLLKRSFTAPELVGWQKRYCEIRGQKLLYYKSSDKRKLDGVIDFNLLTCLITVPKTAADDKVSGKVG